MDLKRHSGSIGISVVEKIDRHDIWRVRTDIQSEYDKENPELQIGVTFIEKEFPYKPSMNEIKDFVLKVINDHTDKKILSGMVWNGLNIWLSKENQTNYKNIRDAAKDHPELILPYTFKLWEDEATKEAVYHTFTTFEELEDFYLAVIAYIGLCVLEGWQIKDNFDFTPYLDALDVLPPPVVEYSSN